MPGVPGDLIPPGVPPQSPPTPNSDPPPGANPQILMSQVLLVSLPACMSLVCLYDKTMRYCMGPSKPVLLLRVHDQGAHVGTMLPAATVCPQSRFCISVAWFSIFGFHPSGSNPGCRSAYQPSRFLKLIFCASAIGCRVPCTISSRARSACFFLWEVTSEQTILCLCMRSSQQLPEVAAESAEHFFPHLPHYERQTDSLSC